MNIIIDLLIVGIVIILILIIFKPKNKKHKIVGK